MLDTWHGLYKFRFGSLVKQDIERIVAEFCTLQNKTIKEEMELGWVDL